MRSFIRSTVHLYGGCCRCLLSPALKFIRPLLLYSLPFFDSTVPYSFLNNSARFSSGKSSKLDGNLFSFNQSETKSTKNGFVIVSYLLLSHWLRCTWLNSNSQSHSRKKSDVTPRQMASVEVEVYPEISQL